MVCVRVVQKGAGRLESENAWVSKVTNGTWLQLVRSCTLSTVQLVPCVEGESVLLRSGVLSRPVTANEVSVKEKIEERN